MAKLKDLVDQVKRHRDLYYNDEPEISDKEYDELEDRLKEEDPENHIFMEIGKDESYGLPKTGHIIHMNSQEKVNNPEDFLKWCRKLGSSTEYIIEHKLDGISVELQYKNGEFVQAVTRGDGKVGDDISDNVRKMIGLVEVLNDDTEFTGGVRGEIVLYKDKFEEKYSKENKNPRNTASGISKRKDGEGCEDLTIIVYDALRIGEYFPHSWQVNSFKTETEKLSWMHDNGFIFINFATILSPEAIVKYIDINIEKKDTFQYNVDGFVIKSDIVDLEDQKRSKPQKQIAYKWQDDTVTTTLKNIVWEQSGSLFTPVAEFVPVELEGTTVKRASLSNHSFIEKLGLYKDCTIEVKKAGSIIPAVVGVVDKGDETKEQFKYPQRCPACGGALIRENVKIYCFNDGCPSKDSRRLEKWIKKLDVKGFGPALLEHIFSNKLVIEISDFYSVDLEEVLTTTNLKKATKKAFDNLRAVKEISLETFVAGFDLYNIGERVVQFAVDEGFDTLEKLRDENLETVKGFGPERAVWLNEGIKLNWDRMQEVLKYIKIKNIEENGMAGKLDGNSFCITGKLETVTRDEAHKLILKAGGDIKKTVVKGLEYLVTNSSTDDLEKQTTKMKRALDLGVKIITEKEFLQMIES